MHPGEGVARDDPRRYREDEADDAAEKTSQRRDHQHDERVDVERLAHHLRFDEVLQHEVGHQDHRKHDHSLGEPAIAQRDHHGEAAAQECADVGDVAADEVHHDDREHERQAEKKRRGADDDRHDGRHDGAALPIAAQDCARVTDEVVDFVA